MNGPVPLDTLADRIWYAWQCGARDKDGAPTPWRILERTHGLPESVLSGLLTGRRRNLSAETATRLARALGVSLDWLMLGAGEAPKLTGPLRPLGVAPRRGRRGLFWGPGGDA